MGPNVLNVNSVFIMAHRILILIFFTKIEKLPIITQMEANNFLSDFIHLVEIIDTF